MTDFPEKIFGYSRSDVDAIEIRFKISYVNNGNTWIWSINDSCIGIGNANKRMDRHLEFLKNVEEDDTMTFYLSIRAFN